jgi:hypothetical protein
MRRRRPFLFILFLCFSGLFFDRIIQPSGGTNRLSVSQNGRTAKFRPQSFFTPVRAVFTVTGIESYFIFYLFNLMILCVTEC